MHMHADLIGSAEAAAILRVDRTTFNRWAARGDLPCVLRYPGATGPRLFTRSTITQLAKDRG